MTYLSQVQVGREEAAQRGLRDAYAWHQAIWEAFPGDPSGQRDFLFRLDDQREYFRILLLSERRPNLPEWGEWRTAEVKPSFLEHERYRFQLRANPTIRKVVRDEEGRRKKNGPRVGIYDEEGLRAWLDRRAEQAGFAVVESVVGTPRESFFVKKGSRGKHNDVDYQGLLQVIDRGAFERAFRGGIGPAKAFGFGLLMLQPVD